MKNKTLKGSDISNKIERYANALSFTGTSARVIGDAAGMLGVPGAFLAGRAVESATKEASKITQEGKGLLKTEAVSLTEQKKKISELLEKLQNPILVVIDDIDRLTTEEILQIFQLVKVNADFPNIIYLLLFDRERVGAALNEVSNDRGGEYLEKIVQIGYHIPHVTSDQVLKVLTNEIQTVFDGKEIDELWEKERWLELYSNALSKFFKNLRHVYRFISSFKFHVNAHSTRKSFEVNPIDLIMLEILRVFEPKVYESLPEHKYILIEAKGHEYPIVNQTARKIFEEKDKNTITKSLEQILLNKKDENKNIIEELIHNLFPALQHNYSRSSFWENQSDWYRSRRVCHKRFFDKYFSHAVPDDHITQAELGQLRSVINDRKLFVKHCQRLENRGLLKSAFEGLDAYKDMTPPDALESLLTALCDLSDNFPKSKLGMYERDTSTYAYRLLASGIKKIENKKERYELLKIVFKKTSGIALPVDIVSLEERTTSRIEMKVDFLLEDKDADRLKAICIKMINAASVSENFLHIKGIREILLYWSFWDVTHQPKQWFTRKVQNKGNILRFLEIIVQYMLRSRGNYTNKVLYYIDFYLLEKYTEIVTVEDIVHSCDITKLSKSQKIAVKAFQDAVQRRKNGQPDDAWKTQLEGYVDYVDEDVE